MTGPQCVAAQQCVFTHELRVRPRWVVSGWVFCAFNRAGLCLAWLCERSTALGGVGLFCFCFCARVGCSSPQGKASRLRTTTASTRTNSSENSSSNNNNNNRSSSSSGSNRNKNKQTSVAVLAQGHKGAGLCHPPCGSPSQKVRRLGSLGGGGPCLGILVRTGML